MNIAYNIKKTFKLFRDLNIFKTVYYSIKWGGVILVGRKFDLHIHKNAKIKTNGGRLYLGIGITYAQHGTLDMYESSVLETHGNVMFHKGSKIMLGAGAKLEIGNMTYINEHSRIQCRESISIGERCAISWNVDILDTDEHQIIYNGITKDKTNPVKIGNHVWIGCKSIILKGSNIEDNVIIGAGSLVNKHCYQNSLYVGNPCKNIKNNVTWQ